MSNPMPGVRRLRFDINDPVNVAAWVRADRAIREMERAIRAVEAIINNPPATDLMRDLARLSVTAGRERHRR